MCQTVLSKTLFTVKVAKVSTLTTWIIIVLCWNQVSFQNTQYLYFWPLSSTLWKHRHYIHFQNVHFFWDGHIMIHIFRKSGSDTSTLHFVLSVSQFAKTPFLIKWKKMTNWVLKKSKHFFDIGCMISLGFIPNKFICIGQTTKYHACICIKLVEWQYWIVM
mgnify:CR=1 FL=1